MDLLHSGACSVEQSPFWDPIQTKDDEPDENMQELLARHF